MSNSAFRNVVGRWVTVFIAAVVLFVSQWVAAAAQAQGDSGGPEQVSVALQKQFQQLGKIDGEILAHQAVKVRPPSRGLEEHVAYLRYAGLNPENLDREDCALYVQERLTAAEIEELKQHGIVVDPTVWIPPVPAKHAFGFHLATVGYASLDAVRADPRIVYLASNEFAYHPANDLGGEMINVDDVHAGNNVLPRDGTGIKIAIADSGMLTTHPDLPTPVEAYDLTDIPWDGDVTNTAIDHGTHVTGTAVGDGAASLGGLYEYIGAAPGADLYFYKIGSDDTGSAASEDIIEAIDRAIYHNCDVFSMSYGGYRTYMDGSEQIEQAIDAAFAAGVVCFLSAGNEVNYHKHYSVTVTPDTTSPVFSLTIDNSGSGSPYTNEQWIQVIWRDDYPSDRNLVLACSNLAEGETLVEAFQGTSARSTEAKRYVLTPNIPGINWKTYNLTLENTATSGTAPLVHCYRTSGRAFFNSPDPSYTVTGPAIADDAIAVGAWTQRRDWTDWLNNPQSEPSFTVGTLASFSGRGPRVDGVLKPDIVAPGAATISCRDVVDLSPEDERTIDDDGINDGTGPAQYYVKWGTSMAAPLAAGSAVLLLESQPSLTPSEVRSTLQATASMAATPDNDVGYGLIDVQAAIVQAVGDCNSNAIADDAEVAGGYCHFPETLAENTTGGPSSRFVGPPDDELYGIGGQIVTYQFDCRPIFDGSGPDFTVYEWDEYADEFYKIDVLVSADGVIFHSVKDSETTAVRIPGDEAHDPPDNARSYDLAGTGLATVRYVKIDGEGTEPGGETEGFDLDAIGAVHLGWVDCNTNGVPDDCDLDGGASFDCNANDLLDECEVDLPTLKVSLGVRETNSTGPIGSSGGSSGTIEWINIEGQELVLDGTWQRFTWDLEADSVTPFTGNGILDGSKGTFEHLRIKGAEAVGPFTLWIDQIVDTVYSEGAVQITGFEGYAPGAEVMFRGPGYSGTTATFIADGDWVGVDDTASLEGDASYTVYFAWKQYNPGNWLRLTTHNASEMPTPIIAFDDDSVVTTWIKGVATGGTSDCNANDVPDECDVAQGASEDCNANGIPDECDVAGGTSDDCNANGIPDSCDTASGTSLDCQLDGVPDECQLVLDFTYPAPLDRGAYLDHLLADDVFAQLCTDGAGNWLAVWASSDPTSGLGPDSDILVTRSSDLGVTWTDPVPLNNNAYMDSESDDDDSPAIANDGDGNWVAVWSSYDWLNPEDDDDILVARSTDDGATWTDPELLNTNADIDSGHDYSPEIATDGEGNWVAVWVSRDPLDGIGPDDDILVAHITTTDLINGLPWTDPAPLNNNAESDSGVDLYPQLATNGAGHWIAVWQSDDPLDGIGSDADVLVSHITTTGLIAGAPWAAPAPLNSNAYTDDPWEDLGPRVTPGDHGRWVAVWTSDYPSGDDWDIAVARSDDNGLTWTDLAPLNNNAGTDSGMDFSPRLAADGAGGWVAAWSSTENLGGGIGEDEDILFAYSDDDGTTWTDPAALNENAGADSGPDLYGQMATDGVGNWVVVWTSGESLGGSIGEDWDVLFARTGFVPDCNANDIADECDISDCPPGDPTCYDCDGNGVPDGCQADCNGNLIPDVCEPMVGGDYTADGMVDLDDYADFFGCMSGPGVWPSPSPSECADACLAAFDFDDDNDVDLADFAAFQMAFGSSTYCGVSENCQFFDGLRALSSDDNAGQVRYEGFITDVSGALSLLCWEGAWHTNAPCSGATPNNFRVRYYADDLGQPNPEVVLAEYTTGGGGLIVSQEDTGETLPEPDTTNVHRMTASHSPLFLMARTCYWIEIAGLSDDCEFLWAESAPELGGNNYSAYGPADHSEVYVTFSDDLSFCVNLPLYGGCEPQ